MKTNELAADLLHELFGYRDGELVIGWVQGKLDVPAIETALQAQLDEQAAPTKAAGVPWA